MEHSFRVTQYVVTGHPVNPGVVGHVTDLVWLHFTINVAVYVAFVAAAALYLRRGRTEPNVRAAEVAA